MYRSYLLFVLLIIFIVFLGCGEKKSEPELKTQKISQEELGKKAICPVCGKEFTISDRTPAFAYKGKIYYFCTWEEKREFAKEPEKFLPKGRVEEKVSAEGKKAMETLGYEIHKVKKEEVDQIVPCPGCQMYLTVTSETPALEKDGEIFYFCSKACMEAFLRRKK